jgi:hypothetical protein
VCNEKKSVIFDCSFDKQLKNQLQIVNDAGVEISSYMTFDLRITHIEKAKFITIMFNDDCSHQPTGWFDRLTWNTTIIMPSSFMYTIKAMK